ncbi:RNA polymerase sigma factor SigJ [Kitasatospora sp. NPDC006786]|uniref:RNA polymerase sigma factor SigJ n=1 Tax=unclassified Kitasatospora TaxID=2633591 RepID=UPI0033C1273B
MSSTDVAGAAGYRPLLFSIAYGMTGSVGDAEDLVQDTFLGLARADRAGTAIADPKAYLTTTVTRLGINHLRSARVRRETYVGEWLPEPVVTTTGRPGPAEHAELADTLSMAFLVLLEALSPVERAVFTLREAFGYGYPEVAETVGRSEANCRQILSRARKRLAAAEDGPVLPAPAHRAQGEELARRFFEAAEGGDLDALLGMLAPDVVVRGDGGGKARALARSVTEPLRVARLLVGGLRRVLLLGARLVPARVNGRPGAVVYDAEQRVAGVIVLDIDADGAVRAVHSVSNPDKLGHLGPVSDLGLRPAPKRPSDEVAPPGQ